MSNSRPKLTNPLRPVARYRKGQAPANAVLSDSDSEIDDELNQDESNERQPQVEEYSGGEEEEENNEEPRANNAALAKRNDRRKMAVSLREVEVDEKGTVKVRGLGEVGRTEGELQQIGDEEESEEEATSAKRPSASTKPAGDESEEGSSEYETDSEEEAPAPLYKPVFIAKRNRETIAAQQAELDPDVIEAKRQAEIEKRSKESRDLVADSILREISEKTVAVIFPDVDDTDGLDPAAEFEAWKLRELLRIKRDKEAQYAREKEREEVEARRALPERLRLKEDTERARKSREEKKKGQQVFLQKYHHKGAFYTDSEVLKKHDYTAPSASTIKSVESLPAIMQKRNFGKAHQTKYTHLRAEDTTQVEAGWSKKSSAGGRKGDPNLGAGCFHCGGPHMKKDCPQANFAGPSGANARSTGSDSGYGARREGNTTSDNGVTKSRGDVGRRSDKQRDAELDYGDGAGKDYRDKPRYREAEFDQFRRSKHYAARDLDPEEYQDRREGRSREGGYREFEGADARREDKWKQGGEERRFGSGNGYGKHDDRSRGRSRSRSPPERPYEREDQYREDKRRKVL